MIKESTDDDLLPTAPIPYIRVRLLGSTHFVHITITTTGNVVQKQSKSWINPTHY